MTFIYEGVHDNTFRLRIQYERPWYAFASVRDFDIVTSRGQVGQVTPLHKGGQHRERNNYRPISELPILSKIIEKHVAHSLLKYLQENNLLYELK